jgi:hypothetical protein
MTFDESHAAITESLCGRTIEYVGRVGKQLEFACSDGHVVVLQADVNGDIHFVRRDVRIVLPGLSEMLALPGRLTS